MAKWSGTECTIRIEVEVKIDGKLLDDVADKKKGAKEKLFSICAGEILKDSGEVKLVVSV
jgi:hypothetical protein